MTDVTENEEDGVQDEAPKSGRGRLLLIGGAAIGLLLAAGAGAFFLMGTGGGQPAAVAGAESQTSVFYDLPEITVNLNTNGQAAEFLKLSIALEVQSESMIPVIEPRLPRVMDAFQVYLRELRRSDLEGSAGIYRLKEELQRRINLAVYPATVENVLFKEILVQ
ncbi:flagellar basal body-associated FliL family protein [Pelagibacterium xiamenense]|uniref:flagellar basal body-associated FliL family protein n=1 Tax=Pelagibacterium xiamenense TaxID=2901140 RepID=UPI001E2FAD17|nr:flagellar basal body-associated FliL family protein [Pelagibacterium xiamenense]MCD7060005.1 flagellar basal body-associated FliL family protein [Pelagibacterium xiamenense]